MNEQIVNLKHYLETCKDNKLKSLEMFEDILTIAPNVPYNIIFWHINGEINKRINARYERIMKKYESGEYNIKAGD